jgi:hypothetical protein
MTDSLDTCRASTMRHALVACSDDIEEVRAALFAAEERYAEAERCFDAADKVWMTAAELGCRAAADLAEQAVNVAEAEMERAQRMIAALSRRLEELEAHEAHAEWRDLNREYYQGRI